MSPNRRSIIPLFVALTLGIASAPIWPGAPSSALAADAPAPSRQETFASPRQAVDALIAAARSGRTADLLKIFGPDSRKLVVSGDAVADKNARERFVAAYATASEIENEGDAKAVLVIGGEDWPFPIPMVKQGHAWRFDTKAGEQEILDRRIGRNELSAIEVCRAYVDAQRDYASKPRTADGLIEYAQRFMSTPGAHDGLYWTVEPGEEESPMGPLVAKARAEGYGVKSAQGKRTPYHGYYYRILKRQGKDATGGPYDYVVRGHMIGGFALVAFPASYGASGIMTFIVNQDGVVYQKNLGPNSAARAAWAEPSTASRIVLNISASSFFFVRPFDPCSAYRRGSARGREESTANRPNAPPPAAPASVSISR